MDYYSAVKIKKMLKHKSWKNLKGIMLIRRGQKQRVYTISFHLCGVLGQAKRIYHDTSQNSGCLRAWWVLWEGARGKFQSWC